MRQHASHSDYRKPKGKNMTDPNANAVPPPLPATEPTVTAVTAAPVAPQASRDLGDGTPATLGPKKDIEITHVIYGLMAAGYVTGGLGSIAAIILNYIKIDDVKGTPLEGHFRWQMRTFWWGLLWGALSVLLMFVVIGFFTLIAAVIWNIYRIAKGWMRLNDGKPIDS
jgi:uncharacterized membrane protein